MAIQQIIDIIEPLELKTLLERDLSCKHYNLRKDWKKLRLHVIELVEYIEDIHSITEDTKTLKGNVKSKTKGSEKSTDKEKGKGRETTPYGLKTQRTLDHQRTIQMPQQVMF